MKKQGFYLRAYGFDCFMESDMKNISNSLAMGFLDRIHRKLNITANADKMTITQAKQAMRRATMELKTLTNGLQYIDIYGKDFGGYGCDPCENPFERCIVVGKGIL